MRRSVMVHWLMGGVLMFTSIISVQAGSNHSTSVSSLESAIMNGCIKDVKRCLKRNRECVNTKDGWGDTPLMLASQKGDVEKVRLLVEYGATINDGDKMNRTALMEAARWGHKDVVTLLLEKGADVNVKDFYGNHALLCAVEGRHTKVVHLLICARAPLNEVDYTGQTALMLAAKRGNVNMVKLLLTFNADVNAVDRDGNTALSLAKHFKYNDIVQIIESHIKMEELFGLIHRKFNPACLK